MEPVSIVDVAKAAGVSLATVSRVVRNQDCVRPATRDKVLQAIRELNYQPNALGRQLRTQETKTVIVIVPDIANTFFHEILLGIETEAESNGYQVLIADMHNEPAIEKHYFHAIQQRQAESHPEKDLFLYHGPMDRITLTPGKFVVLWPQDAHAAGIAAKDPALCHKCTVRHKTILNGVYWLETDRCEEMLAVCYPIWQADLPIPEQKFGEQLEHDRMMGPDETLGFLFFPKKESCIPLYELCLLYPQIVQNNVVSLPALHNALLTFYPECAARHNAETADSQNRSLIENSPGIGNKFIHF